MRSEDTMEYRNNSPRYSDTKWPVLVTYRFGHDSGLSGNSSIFVIARVRKKERKAVKPTRSDVSKLFTLVCTLVFLRSFCIIRPWNFLSYHSQPSHYFFMSVSFRRHDIQTCADRSTQNKSTQMNPGIYL